MADNNSSILQFVPFSSAIEIGFWHTLTKNKLEKYKLDDSIQDLYGSFVNSKYFTLIESSQQYLLRDYKLKNKRFSLCFVTLSNI